MITVEWETKFVKMYVQAYKADAAAKIYNLLEADKDTFNKVLKIVVSSNNAIRDYKELVFNGVPPEKIVQED